MIEENAMAWGDESVRLLADKPMYLMAACILPRPPKDAIAKIARLMPSNAKKIHWRDMGLKAQKQSLQILSEVPHATSIVVATPLNSRKQERARRKCLETLRPHLEQEGVSVLTLESRGSFADKKDIDFLLYLRRSRVIETIDMGHAEGAAEDRLSIPDQILGAYGEAIVAKAQPRAWAPYWSAIEKSIRVFEIGI